MHDTIVAVLRGGPSAEHEVSLRSGHTALAHLPRERFQVRDIYIDKAGTWHERGVPTTPGRVLPGVDVAFICIHGSYGQDGEVQKVLGRFGVPYTGADPFHAFRASHKVLAKEHAREAGIRTPRYVFVEREDGIEAAAREAVRSFHPPLIVKPVDGGSSLDTALVAGFQAVSEAMRAVLANGSRGVLAEERVRGVEATVGVIERLRGEELYALPPVEIVLAEGHEHFSYEAKYDGTSIERCPGRFSRAVSDELMEAAKAMHRALGQRHYSRSDFIVNDAGIHFLELNTAAAVGLTQESLFPKSLVSVGVTLPDFLTHVVDLAQTDGRR
jgi:D-alanine-D-alanine ligase